MKREKLVLFSTDRGRGASYMGRSNSVSGCGLYMSENAGMSSENYVRIIMAENLRIPEEGSSAPGKSEAKARPKGVVDAQTVEIPLPQKDLSKRTHGKNRSRPMVEAVVRERKTSSEAEMERGEKSLVNI